MIANLHFDEGHDRRTERRLRFCWEAHLFGQHFPRGTVARMIDLNSRSAALLLDGSNPLGPGDLIELGLSYPRVQDDQFEIIRDQRGARVVRTDAYNASLKRVVVEFGHPIAEPPGVENEYAVN